MPVILERNAPLVADEDKFFKQSRRGRFDEIALTDEQKSIVVYRKLEALNSEICDTFHAIESDWDEEFTDMPSTLKSAGISPRIFINEASGKEAISEDDGFILRFRGKFHEQVGIDRITGDIVNKDKLEEIQELTQQEQPMYNLWRFRLAHLVITDGPERKERLMDTVEDQRNRSEAGLIDTITKAFRTLSPKSENLNVGTMAQSAQAATQNIAEQLAAMNPDQRAAVLEMTEIEHEFTEQKQEMAEAESRIIAEAALPPALPVKRGPGRPRKTIVE